MNPFRRPAPRETPASREQHPDPVKELKLRAVAAIDGLRVAAYRQVSLYQDDLQDAQQDLARLTGRLVSGAYEGSPDKTVKVATERISRAEEGVRREHDLILSLSDRIEKAVADSGLTESDLAYLNLEQP
jgi:hypothetical protein